MSDNIDVVEHQKHATAIAELRSDTNGLKEGLSEVKGGLRDVSTDMKAILSAVQSNKADSKPSLGSMVACIGLVLTICIGFMTSVIMPMQEATDKRRVEQDEEDRIFAANLKASDDRIYTHAVTVAGVEGELRGKLESMQTQLNAVDTYGPRQTVNEWDR